MMSYPLEKDKGKSFGIFWAIFQFGSFIGAIIALAINLRQGYLDAVATSTYIVSSPFGGTANALNPRPTDFPWPCLIIGFLSYNLFWYRFCPYGATPSSSHPRRWNYRQDQRSVIHLPGIQGSVGISEGLAQSRSVLTYPPFTSHDLIALYDNSSPPNVLCLQLFLRLPGFHQRR